MLDLLEDMIINQSLSSPSPLATKTLTILFPYVSKLSAKYRNGPCFHDLTSFLLQGEVCEWKGLKKIKSKNKHPF